MKVIVKKRLVSICFSLIIILFKIGCKNGPKNTEDEYRSLYSQTKYNGKIIQQIYVPNFRDTLHQYVLTYFVENGRMKESCFWFNRKRHGIQKLYYSNGRLKEQGEWLNGKRKGLFYYYGRATGKLNSAIEFILFSDSPQGYYANQKYYFNAKGDTLKARSNYYSLHSKDTIQQGENYELIISIDAPIFPQSGFVICNYDSLFHRDGQSCDTVRMKNHIGVYRINNYNTGLNIIRGMIYDYKEITDSSGETFTTGHEFYFKKEFYAKPKP